MADSCRLAKAFVNGMTWIKKSLLPYVFLQTVTISSAVTRDNARTLAIINDHITAE